MWRVTIWNQAPRRTSQRPSQRPLPWSGCRSLTNPWNNWPTDVTAERVWSWRDPHILRALRAGWHGTDLGPLLWQTLADPHPVRLRRLDEADLAGEVTLASLQPLRYRKRRSATLDLTITNHGHTTWPAFSDFGFLNCTLLYRWWANGAMLPNVGGPLPLPRNVGAGETVPMRARIELPTQPASYELEMILNQSLTPNVGLSGGAGLRVPVHIE